MEEMFVCSECWRIVETQIVGNVGFRIRVPAPHSDSDGEPCPGVDSEVIEPWR